MREMEQSDSGKSLRPWAVASLLLTGACAQQATVQPEPEMDALRQRLQALERRVENLEHQILSLPAAQSRSRAELESEMRTLQAQRSVLLERYTDLHPDVRDIDRRLRLLKLQLEMKDQGREAAK
jgi:predicted  nucleic acid-binding Zn-ribbon protein